MFEPKNKPVKLDQTILNFCLIFRTTIENFEAIRSFVLKSGATLVYQTKSADKIYIAKAAEA
jgi:hypothetical protein